MIVLRLMLCLVGGALAGQATESYKDQYCTDPRTMRRHAAYTEWADAYSCTRHRCQPGGRNLAIYTVGCKHVEAPESAIECEEVVEDTNMQFPFCCTRLRCLVVVRGEVWTRVLGQPWETLPAAPWSHMYKMKKPPPGDSGFLPKTPGAGPVFELLTDNEGKEVRRSRTGNSEPTERSEEPQQNAVPSPDIVIALATKDEKDFKLDSRHKRRKASSNFFEDEGMEPKTEEKEELALTDKPLDPVSGERFTNKMPHFEVEPWTEIPQSQWNHDSTTDPESQPVETQSFRSGDFSPSEKKPMKGNLQALVDAIGTRMRDIEDVVQRMSDRVQKKKATVEPSFGSLEFKEADTHATRRKEPKKLNPEGDHYKSSDDPGNDDGTDDRFHNRGSQILRGSDVTATTDQPLFIEDSSLNGYFSDGRNSLRRQNSHKDSLITYMAPVETKRKSNQLLDLSDEVDKKRKKHTHKKKHTKYSHHSKKHRTGDKKKKLKMSSSEVDRNLVSMEDISAGSVTQ